jgi:predicted nuclease of predicted toxin-antitoxin system
MSGSDDRSVATAANTEERTLITLDTDFANITAYPPSQHHGIVVIRAGAQDKRTICDLVSHLVPILAARDPFQELWILEPGRIRIRR